MQPMRWRVFIRGERGEITPHASRGTHEFDQAYGFDVEEYPDLWKLRMRGQRVEAGGKGGG